MFFKKATFSPVELDYLKAHIDDMSVEQLSVALAKSFNAIKVKKLEIKFPEQAAAKAATARTIRGSKIGKRKDLNLFLRSGWEADIARWIKYQGFVWEYEPMTYTFTQFGIKHGTVSYTPDFKVYNYTSDKINSYNFIEVKGFLKAEDKTKLNRFKKFYPQEFAKLIFICGTDKTAAYKYFTKLGVPASSILLFKDIKAKFKDKIPFWES